MTHLVVGGGIPLAGVYGLLRAPLESCLFRMSLANVLVQRLLTLQGGVAKQLDLLSEAGRGIHGSHKKGRVSNPFLDLPARVAQLRMRAGAKAAKDAALIRHRHCPKWQLPQIIARCVRRPRSPSPTDGDAANYPGEDSMEGAFGAPSDTAGVVLGVAGAVGDCVGAIGPWSALEVLARGVVASQCVCWMQERGVLEISISLTSRLEYS